MSPFQQPWLWSTSRSFRIVTGETRNREERSFTSALPSWPMLSTMLRRRSSLSIDPFDARFSWDSVRFHCGCHILILYNVSLRLSTKSSRTFLIFYASQPRASSSWSSGGDSAAASGLHRERIFLIPSASA